MYELTESELQKILNIKEGFTYINNLINDELLIRKIQKFRESQNRDIIYTSLQKLLLQAINSEENVLHLYLQPLDDQLSVLVEQKTIHDPTSLENKLLNPTQFLNTLSEIAFATHFIQEGWTVKIEKKIFNDIDIDVYAKKKDDERFIEIVNLQQNELPEEYNHRAVFIDIDTSALKIPVRILNKFKEKFSKAYKNGFSGAAWIAIDIAKADLISISENGLQKTFPNWLRPIAENIKKQCPELAGFIIYRYSPPNLTLETYKL